MPQKPTPNKGNPPPALLLHLYTNNNNKAPAPPSPPVYRLANIPSSLEATLSDSCMIKACLASLLFDQKLLPGSSSGRQLSAHRGIWREGILKALSGKSVSSAVDEWLEFERTELRPALLMSSGNKNAKKKIDAALDKISTALEVHGVSVVGDEPLSVADVAIMYNDVIAIIKCGRVAIEDSNVCGYHT